MFKKLRNWFILINLLSTSVILLAAYLCIYLFAYNSAEKRDPLPSEAYFEFTQTSLPNSESSVREYIEERVVADRHIGLKNLLIVLLITGCTVEVVVALVSYLFAEEAIRPVREAYETQKIFIANASHEIKTPIAAIKANLEAADLSETNRWIHNIEIEADKIETMNLDLLKLARSDLVNEIPVPKDVDLKSLVNATIESFESRIRQKPQLKFSKSFQLNDKTSVKINEVDFKEILEILIDNALKYSHKKIRLTVTSKTLAIKNDGATIPAEKLHHVFDRFYQVDKTANGSGLGLAIAASLANRNHWTLKADSDSSSTSFTLNFN